MIFGIAIWSMWLNTNPLCRGMTIPDLINMNTNPLSLFYLVWIDLQLHIQYWILTSQHVTLGCIHTKTKCIFFIIARQNRNRWMWMNPYIVHCFDSTQMLYITLSLECCVFFSPFFTLSISISISTNIEHNPQTQKPQITVKLVIGRHPTVQ